MAGALCLCAAAKCVFKCDLKHRSVLHWHSSCDNPFQMCGPATEKQQCPTEVPVRGMLNKSILEERRARTVPVAHVNFSLNNIKWTWWKWQKIIHSFSSDQIATICQNIGPCSQRCSKWRCSKFLLFRNLLTYQRAVGYYCISSSAVFPAGTTSCAFHLTTSEAAMFLLNEINDDDDDEWWWHLNCRTVKFDVFRTRRIRSWSPTSGCEWYAHHI